MGFDVREFARSAQGSLRGELDLEAFATSPLAPAVAEGVGVLGRLEGATMDVLRNMLVTATHKDARVTAFLVTWAYERYWVADAYAAIAAAHVPSLNEGATDAPELPGAAEPAEVGATASRGPGPVRRALAGFVQGRAIVGAHLAALLVDDLVLGAIAARVVEAARMDAAGEGGAGPGGAAALAEAVERIGRITARHDAFLREEVARRLAGVDDDGAGRGGSGDRRAARLAARELRRWPLPLGAGGVPETERDALLGLAFGGDGGREAAAAVVAQVGAVPGLEATARVVATRLGAATTGADATHAT
ncbi:hypothetical protein ARHIZOSPH14_08500 [Agromyces rhizosphaerae]|uniref:Uncharacterized protein n=1 Tax=Agromyces rhizosphaerae TaxID=88374 RepID=A0A9W6CQE3_9MICO|nr:hypothetical protein [Agromyces rhizosphaerae]GLI26608.1 hypothetical protein ARHIZOSPH14_08500 [Agromyces rhizosphaerae]